MKHEWIDKYMVEAERLIIEQQIDSGLNILNGLLYEEPGYGNLHNHIGWAHLYYTLNYEQAEVHLKAAIRFQPDFHAPYLHLGTLYYRQVRYAEAIDILSTGSTKPYANKTTMLDMIGQSYEMQREFKMAIRAYREAMLSTLASHEMNIYSESIKRCRKKRWKVLLD